jgi:hypothetical protein
MDDAYLSCVFAKDIAEEYTFFLTIGEPHVFKSTPLTYMRLPALLGYAGLNILTASVATDAAEIRKGPSRSSLG